MIQKLSRRHSKDGAAFGDRRGGLIQRRLPLDARAADFVIELTAPPLRLALDPEFDLFRRLAPGENPPSLSSLFGAARGLIVLSAAENEALASGCLLYTSPSPRDRTRSRMPSSA